MATFFRRRIAHKLISAFNGNFCYDENVIPSLIKVGRNRCKHPQLLLPFNRLVKAVPEIETSTNFESILKSLRNQGLPTAEGIIDIEIDEKIPRSIVFTIDKHVFHRIVLLDICLNSSKGIMKSSCILQNLPRRHLLLELRSPSIGNSFTTDHFQSSIYFNFISKIFEFAGMDLTRLNQIEDWGPSCAVLLAGYLCYGIDEELERNPLQHLSEVLKAVNVKAKNDPIFNELVSECIEKMKNNDEEIMSLWIKLRKHWLKEINQIYKRLGITFDETHCDSMLQMEIDSCSNDLIEKQLVDLESENIMHINVESSEGSICETVIRDMPRRALYSLARNIASSVKRKEKFNFQNMYSIVKKDEAKYYCSIFKILELLGFSWSRDLSSIPIAHAQWLNRKAKSAISISLVLDNAKTELIQELKREISLESNTNIDDVAENLAISSIISFLFKHKRKEKIIFDIDDSLQFSQNSGIAYQLLHAGLLKIQEYSDFKLNFEIDLSPLGENEAINLIQHLAMFDEVIFKAYTYLEPRHIVQYVDTLCYFTKNSLDVLTLDIKVDRIRVIKARLLLFHATQKILCQCLKLLGLQPLEKIY